MTYVCRVVLGGIPVFLGWYGINKAPVLIEDKTQEGLLISAWAKLVLDQLSIHVQLQEYKKQQ